MDRETKFEIVTMIALIVGGLVTLWCALNLHVSMRIITFIASCGCFGLAAIIGIKMIKRMR